MSVLGGRLHGSVKTQEALIHMLSPVHQKQRDAQGPCAQMSHSPAHQQQEGECDMTWHGQGGPRKKGPIAQGASGASRVVRSLPVTPLCEFHGIDARLENVR